MNQPSDYKSPVSAVLGASLSLLAILIAVLSILRAQIVAAGIHADALGWSFDLLKLGLVGAFVLAAACAALSRCFIFDRQFICFSVTPGHVFWLSVTMIGVIVVCVGIWIVRDLVL